MSKSSFGLSSLLIRHKGLGPFVNNILEIEKQHFGIIRDDDIKKEREKYFANKEKQKEKEILKQQKLREEEKERRRREIARRKREILNSKAVKSKIKKTKPVESSDDESEDNSTDDNSADDSSNDDTSDDDNSADEEESGSDDLFAAAPPSAPVTDWSILAKSKASSSTPKAINNSDNPTFAAGNSENITGDFSSILSFMSAEQTMYKMNAIRDGVVSGLSRSEEVLNSMSKGRPDHSYREKIACLDSLKEATRMCEIAEIDTFDVQLKELELFINGSSNLDASQWAFIKDIIQTIKDKVKIEYTKRTTTNIGNKLIMNACKAVGTIGRKSGTKLGLKAAKVTDNAETVGRILAENREATSNLSGRIIRLMGGDVNITPEIESYINTGLNIASVFLKKD